MSPVTDDMFKGHIIEVGEIIRSVGQIGDVICVMEELPLRIDELSQLSLLLQSMGVLNRLPDSARIGTSRPPPTFVDFNGIDVEKDTHIMAIAVKCIWSSVTPDQDRSEGISIGCLIMRVPLVIRSVPQIH